MLEFLLDPNIWVAFLTLVAIEIVLGIDNIIFISVLANRVPESIRDHVRRFGLLFALVTRVLLLLSLSWVMGLTESLFKISSQEISGRDLILFFGGLFLIWKSTKEIYFEVEVEQMTMDSPHIQLNEQTKILTHSKIFWSTIIQIGILDIVFSLDSVITAVGLVDHLSIMIAAVLVAIIVMLCAAKSIGNFVYRYPSMKVLALSFLTVIGVALIAESMDAHIPKGYIYFAMAFSLLVEFLNIRGRNKKRKTV